jgi:hypothetical protein
MYKTMRLIQELETRTLFALTTFTIDPAVSSLRLSGNVANVLDMEAQQSGSLNDFYDGSIVADVTDNSISFPGSSNIVAKATRSYDPGTGPANYGAKAETGGIFSVKIGEAAVRDFAFDLQSSNLTLADSGAFGASGLDIETTGGTLKYDLRVGDDGDINLDNKTVDNHAAGNATLRGEGENRTLTIPVDFDLEDGSTTLRFRGTLVAKTGTGAPIDPNVIRIGDGTLNRSVTFTDADGTVASISVKGGGTADVTFQNASQQTSGRSGTVIVRGTGVTLEGIDVVGTASKSKVGISGKGGDGVVHVPSVGTDGAASSIGGKGSLFIGSATVNGSLKSLTASGLSGATVTADSIGVTKIGGDAIDSTITLDAPYSGGSFAAKTFTVSRSFSGSRLFATGAIGTVRIGTLTGSEIYSGVNENALRFPATSDVANDGAIVSVASKIFADSVVAADTMGKLKLGAITTANGGNAFGIVADSFTSLQATNASKQKLTLIAADDPNDLAALLTAQEFESGDFAIRLK